MASYRFIRKPDGVQVAQITNLYRAAGWWGDGPDLPEHVIKLVENSHMMIVAVEDETIIGMARVISDRTSDAYIQDDTVRKDYRRKGIATNLVDHLVKALHADGIFWIALIAERGTRLLYEGLGFREMQNSTPLLLKD